MPYFYSSDSFPELFSIMKYLIKPFTILSFVRGSVSFRLYFFIRSSFAGINWFLFCRPGSGGQKRAGSLQKCTIHSKRLQRLKIINEKNTENTAALFAGNSDPEKQANLAFFGAKS